MTAAHAFDDFFDDAATFPPGNAPLGAAVAAHLARRSQPDGRYAGPFVCRASAIPELAALLGDDRTDVSVVGVPDGPLPEGLTLLAVEVVDVGQRPDVPDDVTVFVERPWGASYDVPEGTVLKLRCGGAYVPTVDELAGAIRHCVDSAHPFKLTAGLHHAIRTRGEHGFLNVMAAVTAAASGKDPAAALAADHVEALDLDHLERTRTVFRSIGTCSIDEPLADLRALGLVA
jgi:hypothetical protein